MEFLLEIDGSRKELCTQREGVVKKIEEEVGRHFRLKEVFLDGLSAGSPVKAGANRFIVQRWSSKWGEYVDTRSCADILSKDKLRVLLKCAVSSL